MHLLERRLLKHSAQPLTIPVWFNPWRYEKEEHLIIPFLKTIEHDIENYIEEQKGKHEKFLVRLKTAAQKIGDAAAAFAYGLKADCKLGGVGIEFDVSKAAVREKELSERRIAEAKRLSEKMSSIYYDIVDELESAVDEKRFRIVIFIDDLDRCMPDKAVELLEAIKLFLDIEGYLFVMGVDRDVVKKGISYRYRFFEHKEEKEKEDLIISPEDYLDKMIQLPLELPPIESGRKRRFIESLMGEADGFKKYAGMIEIGVGDNPRTLKRYINLLAFTVRLAETVKHTILKDQEEIVDHKKLLEEYFIPEMYIKWSIIVFRFPDVHRVIKGNRKKLIELQAAAIGEEEIGVSEVD
jgi:predicted KAP-like P-loop ATPase